VISRAAKEAGDTSMTRLLLERGANPDSAAGTSKHYLGGCTPLHWAIRYDGRLANWRYEYLDTEKPRELIKLLVEYGASIEAPSCKVFSEPLKNHTSLDSAVHQRNGDAVRVLVEMGAW
jgi:ankyrin repeat protein